MCRGSGLVCECGRPAQEDGGDDCGCTSVAVDFCDACTPANPRRCQINRRAWQTYVEARAAIMQHDVAALCSCLPLLQIANCDFRRWPVQKPLLHWTAKCDAADCCQYLLDRGADVNAQDRHGGTALHVACYFGSDRTVQRLLAAPGVQANKLNSYGETPVQCVVKTWR
jgi:hypothetical protein